MLIYCTKCEAPNEDDEWYCCKCGSPLKHIPSTTLKTEKGETPLSRPNLERQIYRAVLKALLVAGFIFAIVGGCTAAYINQQMEERAMLDRYFGR